MQRSWRYVAYWLAPYGLLSLLPIEPKTTSPELTSPIVDWVLPHQTLIKKMYYSFVFKY